MKSFSKVLDRIDYLFFYLAKIAVFLMMILTTFDALLRYLLNQPIIGAYDFTEKYLMIAVVFLSMSYVWKLNGHVRMDLIIERLPRKFANLLNMLYNLLGSCLMFVIGYQAMLRTMDAWEKQYVDSGIIAWPTWASVILVSIGAYMFAIRLFAGFIAHIVEIFKPSSQSSTKEYGL